jgi:MoaA/NifB/PqqE/SkfB family radical SAM enzyme
MQNTSSGPGIFSSLKAAWHTERINQLREGRDIVPTHVQLIISDLCNQGCTFCAYRMDTGFSVENFADEQGNRNPKRFIPTQKAKEILDDCAMLGVGAIEFTGGGEPTVHPDCVEIVGHAQSLGMQTGLVTNGVRLRDHEVYRNLDWLRISLDAGTAETYEKIRESRMWTKVMANLRLAGTFEKPYVGVGFVVTRENYLELRQACLIAKDAGIPYVRISAMFSTEGDGYYYPDLLSGINIMREAAAELQDEKFKVIDFFDDRVGDLHQGRPEYKFCGEQQFVLYIGGDQKVYTCCTNAYTTHGESGDLRAQSFAEWICSHRRYDWDARSCKFCQFNDKNKLIEFMLSPNPRHVNFV